MINVPQYDHWSANGRDRFSDDSTPCYVCAKPIREERIRWMLHIHCGGGVAVTEAEAATLDEAGDLGCHPIGLDCLRRNPELKPYAIKWKPQREQDLMRLRRDVERFTADHAVPFLRNKRRLQPTDVRKLAAKRAVYLMHKAMERGERGEPAGYAKSELEMLVQLVEVYESQFPPAEFDVSFNARVVKYATYVAPNHHPADTETDDNGSKQGT